jgi:hypothetical protein
MIEDNEDRKEKPVEVILPEETIAEVELDSSEPKVSESKAHVQEVRAEEDPVVEAERPKKPVIDEREKALKELRAQYEQQKRIAEAEREARKQAEHYAREQAQQVYNAQNQVQDGNLKIILNAIDATEQAASNAERDYAAAMAAQDYVMAAKAQRIMAQAESHLLQLQNGKQRLEETLQQPTEGSVQEPEIPNFEPRIPHDPVEVYASKLAPKSAQWLREHPDAVNKIGKLTRAHADAVEDGIAPESPDYFRYIESRLGYDNQIEDDDGGYIEEQPVQPVRQAQSLKKPAVSAPVTSSASAVNPRNSNSNSMVLSSDEVEMALLAEPQLSREKAIESYARNKAYLIKQGKLRA